MHRPRRGLFGGETAAKAVLFPWNGASLRGKKTQLAEMHCPENQEGQQWGEFKTSWHLGTNYSLQNQMRINSEKRNKS